MNVDNAWMLTKELVGRNSVTPSDGGCLAFIADYLTPLGFEHVCLDSGPDTFRVSNLWSFRKSSKKDAKTLVFAGHVDVVPTGPLERWSSPPFEPTVRDGKLYGRGASDMKASIASFMAAVCQVCTSHPQIPLNIAFLLTSDEEGPAHDGTVKVCEWLVKQKIPLDYCLVGEPTGVKQTGDMIKNGRRGSLSGLLTVNGMQGHIAYPHLAKNPIHLLVPALNELVQIEWDKGNEYFPPTTWQVSNIHAGTGAGNVIPGHAVIDFNFRFGTQSSPESLKERVHGILDKYQLDYALEWTLGGSPFLTPLGSFVDAVQGAIGEVTGLTAELSTSGGTSDGRFIAQICPQVLELGPPNSSIHKIDEHVALDDIEKLTKIYTGILRNLGA